MIECSWCFIGRDSVQDLSRVGKVGSGSRRKENNLLHRFRVRKKNLDTTFYIELKEGNSTSKSGQAVGGTRWGSLWLCGLFRGTSLQIRRCSCNCRTCDSSPGMFHAARWRSGKPSAWSRPPTPGCQRVLGSFEQLDRRFLVHPSGFSGRRCRQATVS